MSDPRTLNERLNELPIWADYDGGRGLSPERILRLFESQELEIAKLRAGLQMWASECPECDGFGMTRLEELGSQLIDCPACAEIRALLEPEAKPTVATPEHQLRARWSAPGADIAPINAGAGERGKVLPFPNPACRCPGCREPAANASESTTVVSPELQIVASVESSPMSSPGLEIDTAKITSGDQAVDCQDTSPDDGAT
jgi:hypothetical protein